jgi:hypothetical protein
MTEEARWVTPAQGPQLVRWGSVFSGTIISIAVFSLLTALWLALSFGSHDSVVYSNLPWWIGGTAISCMFLAGIIAGVSSGARGGGAGSMGGLTTGALVLLGVGMVVLPTFGIGHIPSTVTVSGHAYSINYLTYWTAFWSVLIGLAVALLGGIIGGTVPRRVDEPYLDLQRVSATTTTPVVPVAAAAAAPVTAVPASVPVAVGQVAVGQDTTRSVVYQAQT